MSADLITYMVIFCAPGIVPAAIFYSRHYNQTPRGENRFPLGLYVVALLTCAFVAFWVGVGLGVEYACSRPSWGNLCGLLGIFVVGPLSSIITVTVVSWLMTYFPLQMKRIAPIGGGIGFVEGRENTRQTGTDPCPFGMLFFTTRRFLLGPHRENRPPSRRCR
jgi:hypothetical protein